MVPHLHAAPRAHDVAEELARITHTTLHHAQEVYEQELSRLSHAATVNAFVTVLAKRRARERLTREKRHLSPH